MIFIGGINKDLEIWKKHFNSLIANENAGEARDQEFYGETNTFYTLNKNSDGFLLYHYYPIISKLYQYRKEQMEAYDNLVISASFDVRNSKKLENIFYHDIEVLANDILAVYSYDECKGFFMNSKELLESFYRGNHKNGSYRMFAFSNIKFKGSLEGFRAFFPYKIKARRLSDYYVTEQVIRVPNSVRILDYLVSGDIDKYVGNSNIFLEQLDCFEFDLEPYDEIGYELFEELCGVVCKNSLFGDTKENILQYTINQAEANEELLRLVKSR